MKNTLTQLFHSFRYRNYLWLWLTVALTNTGKWVFTLAVTWQVYNMTGSSFWSGALMFASMFPNIIGGPIVGVLADKISRRSLIYSAIGMTLSILAIFTILTIFNVLAPIGMIVLALLFGLGISALNVSINTLVPSLVPKEGLYNAYSLQAVGQRGTEFIGPLLAAPILAAFGVQSVYLFGAIVFVLAIIFVSLLAIPNIKTQQDARKEGFMQSLTAGFRYIRQQKFIYGMVILVGFHCALTMAFLGMLPGFVKHDLGAQSSFYGFLMSMVGLGSIFATLFMAGVKKLRIKMTLFWVSAYISGISLALLGMSQNQAMAILFILLVGASQALFMTLTIAFVQENTEEHVRGRVTGVYFVLAAGLMSLANWGYGWLGNIIDPRYIMMTTGLLFTVIVVIYWKVSAANIKKENEGSMERFGA